MPVRSLLSRVVVAALGACLVLFIVGPLLRLLFFASPESLGAALRDTELRDSIVLTVFTASLATLIAALFGVPLAYLLARRNFPGPRGGIPGVMGPIRGTFIPRLADMAKDENPQRR